MDSFISSQERMAYGLEGSTRTLSGITESLSKAINGSGLIKQEAVYNNLSKLVDAGIVYNVEQRAFLQTIADDLGAVFDSSSGSLPRLINLQRQDISSNRLAIQSSLKEFLNQNYETSQYIKNGFQDVSNALLEAQSLMDSKSAMAMEAVLQQWLGSLSSVGMSESTIQSLATAIGQAGSGNISALSNSNMQNLIVMGAARQNLSYGQILTEGVSDDVANQLMQGIVDYISEIGKNTSNVVKSEYARIFGLSVSDLVAAAQVGNPTEKGIVSDDITNLLGKMDNYVYFNQKIENMLSNLLYGWGTNVASDEANYTAYRIVDVLSSVGSSVVSGLTTSNSFLGQGIQTVLSTVLNMAPLLATLPGLIKSFSGGNFLSNARDSLTAGGQGAINIFNRLNGREDGQYIRNVGNVTGFTRTSGLQTSGSVVIANSDTDDIVKTAKNSSSDYAKENLIDNDVEYYDTTDIYKWLDGTYFNEYLKPTMDDNLLQVKDINSVLKTDTNTVLGQIRSLIDEDIRHSLYLINENIESLPLQQYSTISELNSNASNTVTIRNDLTMLQDLMTINAMNVQNIYAILYSKFVEGAGAANLIDLNEFESGDNSWTNRGALSWAGDIQAIEAPASTTF